MEFFIFPGTLGTFLKIRYVVIFFDTIFVYTTLYDTTTVKDTTFIYTNATTTVYDTIVIIDSIYINNYDTTTVLPVKNEEKDGYKSVQLGFLDKKENKFNKAETGHFKKAKTDPKRKLFEFKDFEKELNIGDVVNVDHFVEGEYVDVSGISKGKGFQGVVKRHGFAGVGDATHGQHNRLRAPGSIGAASYPARVFKGMRMAGQTGNAKVKVENLQILKIMNEKNIIVVKGAVPGSKGGWVTIKDAVKKQILERKYPDEPLLLSLSYNTDILALENILPLTKQWIDFANNIDDLFMEIRTKSGLTNSFNKLKPSEKILFAWTLSPDNIIQKYEHKTPLLKRRIMSIQKIVDSGWPVRLSFDPILIYPNWKESDLETLDKVISDRELENIKQGEYDVTQGTVS